MTYNEKRKRLDVQVSKIYNKKRYEVTTASIPGPRQPNVLKQILKRLDKIDNVLERNNLH